MDGAQGDDVMQRALVEHRRAERALARMWGDFGRYEDNGRANRLLEAALVREQETWIAAFGSRRLRELSAQAEARDETGRLVRPWLQAAGAVERRLAVEWQRAQPWPGARPPGQEWSPVTQTYDRPPNPLRAYFQKHAVARATAAADAAWAKYKDASEAPFSKPTWWTRWKPRPRRDLHDRLRAALAHEWNAWVAAHGSRELKQLPSFHPRPGEWWSHESAEALRGMRQLGVEWLAKEYPGWQLTQGYRADGHRPRLGTDYRLWPVEASHQRALEGALGMALGAPMSEAHRVDPTAQLAVFVEAGREERDRGPYVFAAVVERRLPGSWVREPVMLVFGAQHQRELNALAELELGVVPRTGPQEPDRGERGAALGQAADRVAEQSTASRQQTDADCRSASSSLKEATMSDVQKDRAEQLAAIRDALAHQYDKPVVPVPQGTCVEGRVVAVLSGDHPDRMRAVVEGERAVHLVGVGAATAREVLGTRVAVENERGKLTLTPREVQQRMAIDELRDLIELKAVESGTKAVFAPNAALSERAIGAESAYRNVLLEIDVMVDRARPAPGQAHERGR